MWYGKTIKNINLKPNIDIYLKNRLKRRRHIIKLNALFRKKYASSKLSSFFIYIPSCWESFLIQPKRTLLTKNFSHSSIFLFSSTYYFIIPIYVLNSKISYSGSSSCYFFKPFARNNFFLTFWKHFLKIFYAFSSVFFIKLKFRGKGYYIYKNKRNTIAMQFGYSHIKRLFFFYSYVKFLSKTSILIFGCNTSFINKAGTTLSVIKPINIFTGKGVRFTRQIIYRKTGKISSYR